VSPSLGAARESKTALEPKGVSAHPMSYYASLVRPDLFGRPFAPARSRLTWLVLHGALAAAGMVAITRGWGGWPVAVILAVVIGNSFAVMAFVAHEALHGSILRGSFSRHCVGWVGFLGMHVEHHIFPAMSPRHAPDVRRVLETRFPGRYQSLPFGRALLRVFRTAHVYKNATTLIDPRTGREWSPLAPTSEEGAPLPDLR
jgi:fatty acid desaturase